MPTESQTVGCRYQYDPLDNLIIFTSAKGLSAHKFYCKSRLVTEIQTQVKYSILQQSYQLLAVQQRDGNEVKTRLLATDLQRSVIGTLNTQDYQQLAYTVYGHHCALSSFGSPLRFNGERLDEGTGCYLLGNGYRAFNPVFMRFNSPDSLSPFREGGLNPYAYCLGDPINFVDPNGHNPLKWLGKKFRGLFKSSQSLQTSPTSLNGTLGNPLHANQWNFSDYSRATDNRGSLNNLAMRKAEKMLGAIPGSQLEAMSGGPTRDALKIWDNKTGLSNIREHVNYRDYDTSPYEVISAGIAGELNGVLPARANELSNRIITNGLYEKYMGVYPDERSRSSVVSIHQQREVYRQAGMPLPGFLKPGARMENIPINSSRIRGRAR